MSKIGDSLTILRSLGMPRQQQNDRSALTLLALAGLEESASWSDAKAETLRIHDILNFIKTDYGKTYAENTRETIRRQTLHQFVQGGIAAKNPDDPTRPTNSPNTTYALSPPALRTIRAYGTKDWLRSVNIFVKSKGKLVEKYEKRAEQGRIPVVLPGALRIKFSPGKHNQLQAEVMSKFIREFCPLARVLYIGDVANKILHIDKVLLSKLGIPLSVHGKLPDIMLYDEKDNTLFLIEVVTSHGPVSPKRKLELEEALQDTRVKRIYVTAFPDIREFKRHIDNIAWETEVWISDRPNHMIHFNGFKFLTA